MKIQQGGVSQAAPSLSARKEQKRNTPECSSIMFSGCWELTVQCSQGRQWQFPVTVQVLNISSRQYRWPEFWRSDGLPPGGRVWGVRGRCDWLWRLVFSVWEGEAIQREGVKSQESTSQESSRAGGAWVHHVAGAWVQKRDAVGSWLRPGCGGCRSGRGHSCAGRCYSPCALCKEINGRTV